MAFESYSCTFYFLFRKILRYSDTTTSFYRGKKLNNKDNTCLCLAQPQLYKEEER